MIEYSLNTIYFYIKLWYCNSDRKEDTGAHEEKTLGEGEVTSHQHIPRHVASNFAVLAALKLSMCLKSSTGHYYYSLLTIIHFQKCEIQLVYLDELYAAVNNHIERFLNLCTFYFIRSTKGKMNTFLHIFRHLIEELPQRQLFVSLHRNH